ncbi:hypothetical protein C7401_102288 [Paraburkholderia unamae]|uniref:hypothetical protein n=1 Tax=Paraburkholderia unamae TaxID=219649 RepID=UPI000DC4D07B|nr:hypothetical protein [Paraburkholderia unamae]RAR66863.1 hypothetical protein C7401_102288 [Paraburkholderia unamae]
MQSQPRKIKTKTGKRKAPFVSERNKQTRALIRAQRKARAVDPIVRNMLAAWDKAVQDAKDLHATQDRARMAPKPTLDDTASILEHSWPFIVRGLATE